MRSNSKGGQILTSRKILSEFEQLVDAEPIGELPLKGFAKPISAERSRGAAQFSAPAATIALCYRLQKTF